MDELMAYAKTLNIAKEPDDPSDSPFLALQHWYPRMWDEWARDRDGAVADISGEAEGALEIDPKKVQVHFKPILPKFANKYGYHGEPRCANEISFSLPNNKIKKSKCFIWCRLRKRTAFESSSPTSSAESL